MWLYLLLAVAAYLFYVFIVKPMSYWDGRDVPYKKPWPILGNMSPFVFRQKSFVDVIKDLYRIFPGRRYNGVYFFLKPQLLIRDPELIKQITVKDFDHFTDRTMMISEDAEPLFIKNLASLKGQKWRDMRATLSPSFTSSKMRFMFNLISDCAKQLTDYFEKRGTNEVTMDLEMKDTFSRFTNDAIATVAFGISVNSLKERENEFFMMGKNMTNISGVRAFKFFLNSIMPGVMKLLKVPIFPKSMTTFFRRLISETIEMRESKGIVRPDMIHLLLESRKERGSHHEEEVEDPGFAVVEESETNKQKSGQKQPLSDDDITAQALIFFFAGFETTSTLMSFMSYELALNPDVQARLQAEIDEVVERNTINYETILRLKYLDMVVSESLRKWPTGVALDRVCVREYKIPAVLPDEKPITVKEGETIFFPIIGVHHDPQYFPNPEKFDPERFNDENKGNIVPYTYLPFGSGPRNCIASRFALMEIKIVFFHLLSKFDLVPIEKTVIPMKLSKSKINIAPDTGFWLGLKLRTADK